MNQSNTFEFFGLPGSGKTTVKNEIKNKCIQRGIRVLTRDEYKEWTSRIGKISILKQIVINPLVFSKLLFLSIIYYLSLGNKTGEAFLRSLALPVIVLLKYEYCKLNRNAVIIYDLGPIQNIWSVSLNCQKYNIKILENYIRHISDYTGFQYVYFDGDVLLSGNRIMNRKNGKSRLDSMEIDEQFKSLQSGKVMMNRLLNIINENDEVIILDAKSKVNINSQHVIDNFFYDVAIYK
jgi:hypothetical protein